MARPILNLLLILLVALPAWSQSLLESPQRGRWTYIYQLTESEAARTYNTRIPFDSTAFYLHTLVDSFPFGTEYAGSLPPGHYLKAEIVSSRMRCSVTSVGNCAIKVLNNQADLKIQVYDLKGNLLPQVRVRIGRKEIPFDPQTQSFLLKKTNRQGLLTVEYDGLTNYHDLKRSENNPRIRQALVRLLYRPPTGYVWRPIRFVIGIPYDGVRSLVRGHKVGVWWKILRPFSDDVKDLDLRGYLITDKPKYRPGDTVRFKAFVYHPRKKRVWNKPLQLYWGYYGRENRVATLKPYRSGAFKGQFVLTDKLAPKLDRYYRLTLGSRDNVDGWEIEKKVFFEDYELKGIEYALKSETKQHHKGAPMVLKVSARDENDLRVPDARVRLTVTAGKVSRLSAGQAFLPDTLWTHEQDLEPKGDTRIVLPDSIFPTLAFSYKVQAHFHNSSNETGKETLELNYLHEQPELRFTTEGDSLLLECYRAGKPVQENVLLRSYAPSNRPIRARMLTSPVRVAINPYAMRYEAELDGVTASHDVAESEAGISLRYTRSRDSLFAEVANPLNLPFSYHWYLTNRELERGYGTTFRKEMKVRHKRNYYFSLQFLWGGRIVEQNYEIRVFDKDVRLEMDLPRLVYPGQTVQFQVTATDYGGRPVPNLDLTAHGLTAKFENYKAPRLLSFNHRSFNRLRINSFHRESAARSQAQASGALDYPRWCSQAGLEQDEYYQFLYPGQGIFRKRFPISASGAQFSPFVVRNGVLQPIQIVYLDQEPVYFNWNTEPAPYAFAADSGYHQIKLRLNDAEVTLDSVWLQGGYRHVMSFDDQVAHPGMRTKPAKILLTDYEKEYIYPHIFAYRVNFAPHLGSLRQDDHLMLLAQDARSQETSFSGPVRKGMLTFRMTDGTEAEFLFEKGFEYEFGPRLLKMRELKPEKMPAYLPMYRARTELADTVYTQASLEEDYREMLDWRRSTMKRTIYPATTSPGEGYLELDRPREDTSVFRPLNTLLLREDTRDWIRVYPGRPSGFHALPPGKYEVIYLLSDDRYVRIPGLNVHPNGKNYYLRSIPPAQQGPFAADFSRALEQWIMREVVNKLGVQELFDKSDILERMDYLDILKRYFGDLKGRVVSGYVVDEGGEPLPYANVYESRMRAGTNTDSEGYFRLSLPEDADSLVFSSMGYNRKTLPLDGESYLRVVMQAEQYFLRPVMIREEIAMRAEMVYMTDAMSVSGVQVAGVRNIEGGVPMNPRRLIFVDGVKVVTGGIPAEYGDLAGGIVSMDTIPPAEAVALFGEEGRNGAILIKTAASLEQANWTGLERAKPLRSNFRDWAFWKPSLTTDENGIATATVQFPDDVTSWKVFLLGMDDKRHSGIWEGEVRSYKPLMARLDLPRFLLPGDTAFAIGRSQNYGGDTVAIRTRFEQDGRLLAERSAEIDAGLVDSAAIAVTDGDSVDVTYQLTRPSDGYADGELRQIPVYPLGVVENKGEFRLLDRDTSLNLQFDPAYGPVTLHAESEVLDLVLEESRRLRVYRYECNEQLASRLAGLLTEQSTRQQLGQEFAHGKLVRKTIDLLQDRMDGQGRWGWWQGNVPSPWITLHVVRALERARKMGYQVEPNWEDYHINWVLWLNADEHPNLDVLLALAETNAQVNYGRFVQQLDSGRLSRIDRIQLLGLKQRVNLPHTLDSLLKSQVSTVLGAVHWEGEGHWYQRDGGALAATLEAYRVLRKAGGHQDLLTRIRLWLLEQWGPGGWHNTYRSAQLLDLILPDLLANRDIREKPQLRLSGAMSAVVDSFPFTAEIAPGQALQVSKVGEWPVYFTSYQQYRNVQPEPAGNVFAVRTWWDLPDTLSTRLQAGKAVDLIVRVNVKQDADYVMLEVPIPAGCTYASKPQPWSPEVHREYFREQCSIFCRSLKKGTYTFRIPLLTKFSGVYTLNPAKAELMYFPVFFGRNGSKRMHIGGH